MNSCNKTRFCLGRTNCRVARQSVVELTWQKAENGRFPGFDTEASLRPKNQGNRPQMASKREKFSGLAGATVTGPSSDGAKTAPWADRTPPSVLHTASPPRAFQSGAIFCAERAASAAAPSRAAAERRGRRAESGWGTACTVPFSNTRPEFDAGGAYHPLRPLTSISAHSAFLSL